MAHHRPPSQAITFALNGEVVETRAPATTSLLEFVRARGLTGTKEGCAEGDCGACTVAMARPGDTQWRAVNACIMPLAMAHGASLRTVEALGGTHPIQTAMVERHASQCGFCTPGIVMSLWCRPSDEPADPRTTAERLAGNLCRCTGYGPILAAAADAAQHPAAPSPDDAPDVGPLDVEAEGRRMIVPQTEAEFAAAVEAHPDATIIAGATDVGLWITKNDFDPKTAIFLASVPELAEVSIADGTLRIGAGVSHAAFATLVAPHSPSLAHMMNRFGGLQVRSAGTVGGNIANGSPIGDLPPALIAAGASLELARGEERRTIALEDFFLAYGKQDRRPGEYVRAVTVPLSGLAALTCHKVSKRFASDISAVLAAIAIHETDGRVSEARIAFGGMAATPKRAPGVEAALSGRAMDEASISDAQAALADDFAPISDLRASAAYRLRVAQNLLRRDLLERGSGQPLRLDGPGAEGLAA